jgi:hypothetical protein
MKAGKKLFYILLGALAALLLAYGLLRMKIGPFLPAAIDKNLPDVVMFSAIGIMLWNRKILSDEKKAEAARLQAEREAEDARRVEAEESSDDADADASLSGREGKSGTDGAG